MNNTSRTTWVYFDGEKLSAKEFSEKYAVDYVFLHRRLEKGKSIDEIYSEWNRYEYLLQNALTIQKTCEYYQVSEATIWKRIKSGELKAEKCRGRVFVIV